MSCKHYREDTDAHGLPSCRSAWPARAIRAGIIFFQMGYNLEALALDPRFGLAFGKAIRACNAGALGLGGVFGVVTAGVLASLFAGFMLVCAIAGMAEATNKTAIIDLLIEFSFFDW